MANEFKNEIFGREDGKAYKVAIVGSGPGGLSAAGRAAELNVSHILLEATDHLSNTIYRYQKGKFVMDEPGYLPLRSPFGFKACSREQVLGNWARRTSELKINVRYHADVAAIKGEKRNFTVRLTDGTAVRAENVVLAIGLQGNLRKLGVPGEDLPFVQYQLDDPEEYEDETIVVVGAGDAAIENAIGLSKQNNVIIVNRGREFNRAKDGNLTAITRAIGSGKIECYYGATVAKVESSKQAGGNGETGIIFLNIEDETAEIPVHRVLARLGAVPPRKFVESCGIVFPNADPAAIPLISGSYESNVPGLHIVGALGGNPLIKQAMNQGHEVIEHIRGNPVEPADEPLLEDKFKRLKGHQNVAKTLKIIQRAVPFLASLTTLQLREFMLESNMLLPEPGHVLLRHNDYADYFYSIVTGDVKVLPPGKAEAVILGPGDFFGEMGLISGRRSSSTVVAGERSLLIQTKRRTMIKLIKSVEAVARIINRTSTIRAIRFHLAPGVPDGVLKPYAEKATVNHYKPGAVLLAEGDPSTSFHIIRSGSVTITRKVNGREVTVGYLPVGTYVGEVAVMSGMPSHLTATATVATETICLEKSVFTAMIDQISVARDRVESSIQERLRESARFLNHPDSGDVIAFMKQRGVLEATDVLLIDESLCVHCDNCEKACAETHQGTSRLVREAGVSFANINVPTSCQHCEHPHCMKDCPPDAIHRESNGEVYIDDSCIGCGNCETNCPYGVIQMAELSDKRSSLLNWLMFGRGYSPGQSLTVAKDSAHTKKAVKCDMCKDITGGPACVRACPTGAAIRISPEEFVEAMK